MMSTLPQENASPERFGLRYLLIKKVGEGAMGGLSAAFDRSLQRLVLIKRANVGRRDTAAVERFIDEIAIARRLKGHPNIVGFLDAGEVDGEPYLTQDWIAGRDLSELMQQAGRLSLPTPIAVAVGIGRQICSALEFAHGMSDLGFVHRDITPANVVVSYGGTAHLVDFGIALSSLRRRGRTLPGIVDGTRGFFSPEQLGGSGEVDQRSDLFQLGAIIWFLMTGTPCYSPPLLDENQLRTRRLSSMIKDVPVGVDEFLAKAIQPEPNHRFQTAAAMGQALDALSPADPDAVEHWVASLFPLGRKRASEEREELLRLAVPIVAKDPPPPAVESGQPRQRRRPRTTELPAPPKFDPKVAVKTLTLEAAKWTPDGADRTKSRRVLVASVIGAAVVVVAVVVAVVLVLRTKTPPLPVPANSHAVEVAPATSPQAHPVPPPAPAPIAPEPSPTATTPPPTAIAPTSPVEHHAAPTVVKSQHPTPASPVVDRVEAARSLERAQTEFSSAQYTKAIASASQALKLGAGAAAYQTRAEAELRLGKKEDAARDFRAVLKLDPGNEDARAGLKAIND